MNLCAVALVAEALVAELGVRKQYALGVDVGDVDVELRGRRPDVEVVGGVGGVRHELTLVEHRDDDGDVGGVARSVVGWLWMTTSPSFHLPPRTVRGDLQEVGGRHENRRLVLDEDHGIEKAVPGLGLESVVARSVHGPVVVEGGLARV